MPLLNPEMAPAVAKRSTKAEFDALAEKWRAETEDCAIVALRYIHPAYMRIVGLGPVAIPWILEELKARPDWWFDALKALTGEDPTTAEQSFDEAAQAWLRWGARNFSCGSMGVAATLSEGVSKFAGKPLQQSS